MVNRLNPQGAAYLAGLLVLCAVRAGGQTSPLRDPSAVQKTLGPLSASDPVARDGLFSIDVVVADSAGNPVSDLGPGDFTLLDNGQPAKIRTLHHSLAASEPAPELIFVLDGINLRPQQLARTESAVARFLRRNNGHREAPCFIYRITRGGLFSSSMPTRDGNLLASEVEQRKYPRIVWKPGGADVSNSLFSFEQRLQSGPPDLRALGSVAIDQREIAGRKVVEWIGAAWPVNAGSTSFGDATELSTRLREARITLDNVNVWPNPDRSFNPQDLEAPRSQLDMQPAKLALQ